MEKRTWREKMLFGGVCCTYVLVMSASVYVLSQRNRQLNITSLHDPQKNTVLMQLPESNTFKNSLSLIDEKFIYSPEENTGCESQGEMGEPFAYNSKFLDSVRGKDAEKILHPVITRAATQYDVDPALIKAIIWAESSFNPRAVSAKGAVGLMQLMPSTAAALGIEDILNPESNIFAGVRYFKQLLVRFKGDAELALAAYNAGSRRVLEYNGVPPFADTQFYVAKVLKYYKEYKQFELNQVDRI